MMADICGSALIALGMFLLGTGMQLVRNPNLQDKIYEQLRKTFKDALDL